MTEQDQEQVDTGVVEEVPEEEPTASDEVAELAATLEPGETTTENPVTAAPGTPGDGLSMDSSKDELQAAARGAGLDDSGTKQELLDRLNG